ncbi:rab9 effector protein with kelch motifs [Marmota marmota marmota]|uniref:rab9 effector protein with kelch motifs n=1 Tax=Marmota marmota marmota TaxID=9994 RepID=UPI002092AF88|nr:rab9 effector protein with kelch motifs [Marmota marmota marmota]
MPTLLSTLPPEHLQLKIGAEDLVSQFCHLRGQLTAQVGKLLEAVGPDALPGPVGRGNGLSPAPFRGGATDRDWPELPQDTMKQLPVLEPGDKPRKATCYTLPPVTSFVVLAKPSGPQRTHQWDLATYGGLLPRYEHASFIPSCTPGSIWVFGGADQSGNRNCLQVLNLETRIWRTPEVTGPPPSPRTFHTSSAAIGNQLYVFGGGERGAQPVQDMKLHVFDASDMKWQKLSPTGVAPAGCAAHSAVTLGKHIYVFGGMTPTGALDKMYQYHIEKQLWSLLKFDTLLPPGRLDHSMCIIPWPVTSISEKEDSNSVTLNYETEKGDSIDRVAPCGSTPEESQSDILLCFVFGGMNTEGEIYNDCIVTVID